MENEATAEEGKGPRPLLVQVQTQNQAQNIMKSGRKLKEHKDKRFQQIVVKKDMTFSERQEMRNLVILRNQKREETEAKGGKEIWVIRRNKVVNIARERKGCTRTKFKASCQEKCT